jgi:hypothetical protein
LITFWLWLPIGWIALGMLKRRAALLEDVDLPAGLGDETDDHRQVMGEDE